MEWELSFRVASDTLPASHILFSTEQEGTCVIT